ncbi:MAG: DsrE family protein [Cyclobacteriaceae bacterium]|nr:DsrE family protein [Cyclobacteriaceae bacterium]
MKTLLTIPFLYLGFALHAQNESSPLVPDFGKIWDLENVVKPDPSKTYKIVIDLKTPITSPGEINEGLDNVARLLNLHATGGIPKENLSVAVVIHGGATSIALDNIGYQAKHTKTNPNLELIRQLREAGVELFVCGQSLTARKHPFGQVNPEIKIGLSMLTVVTEKMMDGYALMVFN